jgi:hypothetical protein
MDVTKEKNLKAATKKKVLHSSTSNQLSPLQIQQTDVGNIFFSKIDFNKSHEQQMNL